MNVMGADWCKDEVNQNRTIANKILKKIKDQRENKKYKLVKVKDNPPTYKEVEIK